jgi:hypothetical protein
MNRRRGEANFVAVRCGFWNDPRLVGGLAHELGVTEGEAGSFVLRWEEFVLQVGDAVTGRVRGYRASHIAAAVGWKGKPDRLIAALKNAGVLGRQKGTFFHAFWTETVTGQYALRRARDRERHREEKAQGTPAESLGNVHNDSTESSGKNGEKESKDAGQPPERPPEDRGAVAAERWDWLLKNAERPRNPRVCLPLLSSLDDGHWPLVQWVVGLSKQPNPSRYGRKRRVWGLQTDKFLREHAYLEFLSEWTAKQRPADDLAVERKRRLDSLAPKEAVKSAKEYLVAMLGDPDVDPPRKERAKEKWRAQNPSETPPWETA